MRSFDYARTFPEAREGFAVFVVHFAVVIMAREPVWTDWIGVNGFRTGFTRQEKAANRFNEVETWLKVTQ
jgi:hypothetical protein